MSNPSDASRAALAGGLTPAGELGHFCAALAAIAALTWVHLHWLGLTNPTTAALSYLVVVLGVSSVSTLRVAVVVSFAATAALNFFFLPPVGTFTIANPTNWVALFVFLSVSIVASQLSLSARKRTREVMLRRMELARLFDLSRDILLTTDSEDAIRMLARTIVRRFRIEAVAVCLPGTNGWSIYDSGTPMGLETQALERAFALARGTLEFDARERTYGGHRSVSGPEGTPLWLVPLRLGTKPIGLLAASGEQVDAGALDAIAGIAAIAVERANLLEERKAAELVYQSAELKSALLASLSHDLRTPLTAIAVAARNLEDQALDATQRREQAAIVIQEVERLRRLFQNIMDMARIETGAVAAQRQWTAPSELVEAALQPVEHTLSGHPLDISADTHESVLVDPRLTASALAHLLENAAQYSSPGTPIEVGAHAIADGLRVTVRDRGPGIAVEDLGQVFDRFYRGSNSARHTFGTGMGLAITRGLLAVQDGRVWAENHPEGGALFTIVVPGETRSPPQAAEALP